MKTVRIQETTCPTCGEAVDKATAIEYGTTFKPGAWSLCWYCFSWSRVEADGTSLRLADADELKRAGSQVYFLKGMLFMLTTKIDYLEKEGQRQPADGLE